MPEDQFARMREIISAPSPVGLEAGMTTGVLTPMWQQYVDNLGWKLHRFKGNSSLVLDTHPDGHDGMLTLMVVGHADKIRMQVRHVTDDGKVYIDTDSFLPLTLIGNPVTLYCRPPPPAATPSSSSAPSVAPSAATATATTGYRAIRGGTVEALGAIHFADPACRTGAKGVSPDDMYVELCLHGDKRKKQVEAVGIRRGDPILLDRHITRAFGPDTFSGAYLDNGLGCFVASELAALIAARPPMSNVRTLFAIASHEEIGRFGSRVVAAQLCPDILIAADVNHDYSNAPNVAKKRFPEISMGAGFTITNGSITSPVLNDMLADVATKHHIPHQIDVRGRDTGTLSLIHI